MTQTLEQLIEARNDARYELQKAQDKVNLTSDTLIEACIEQHRTEFLKLDDAALSRYQHNLARR